MIHREDFWKIIRAIESKGRITTWPVYIIAEHTAAALYGLAPRHQPRKMEYIMSKFVSRMETHEQVKSHGATGTEKFYYFETDFDGIRTIIHDLLFGIREFRELNLTQKEYEAEVDPDDPNRGGFVLTSRYDVYPEDHWKDDFVDLDAAIQNIMCGLRNSCAVEACFDSPENMKTRLKYAFIDIKRKFMRERVKPSSCIKESSAEETKSFKDVLNETAVNAANSVGTIPLKEFISKYVCHNSMIRLWRFAPKDDGTVGTVTRMITEHDSRDANDGDSEVGMEWELLKGVGWQTKFADCPVIGVTDTLCEHYREAINIIINPVGIDFDSDKTEGVEGACTTHQ